MSLAFYGRPLRYIMEKHLSDLKPGDKAIVKAIALGPFRSKLIEMGCLDGEELVVSKIAPLGCPFAIYISGYELSLRKNEAYQIMVDTLN